MTKAFLLSVILLGTSSSHAWIQQRHSCNTFRPTRGALLVAQAGKKDNSGEGGAALETEDPCWQNFLDDDCQMSNIYSSSFVAAEWIKSMPCGEGIQVSCNTTATFFLVFGLAFDSCYLFLTNAVYISGL